MLTQASLRQIFENLPEERLAIAFSGGGDSTALVHMCRHLKPSPLILIVDHALRSGSKEEAQAAETFAKELGLETRLLTWRHDNPGTGLQEKARRARYGLMGDICRKNGIQYLLTGHTQDDQAETLLMRYEKSTGWRGAAGMAARTYAPVWPELAMVSVLRPLLDISRKQLRDYNQSHKLIWAEDPSNENRNFDRIRARDTLKRQPVLAKTLLRTGQDLRAGLIQENERFARKNIRVDGAGLIHSPKTISSRLASFCIIAAAGSSAMLTPKKLTGFTKQVAQPDFKAATIGGALCISNERGFTFGRDLDVYKGRANKQPVQPIALLAGETRIWDGRFEISAQTPLTVWPAGLSPDWEELKRSVTLYSGVFGPTLPATSLDKSAHFEFRPLAKERLNGFLGIGV